MSRQTDDKTKNFTIRSALSKKLWGRLDTFLGYSVLNGSPLLPGRYSKNVANHTEYLSNRLVVRVSQKKQNWTEWKCERTFWYVQGLSRLNTNAPSSSTFSCPKWFGARGSSSSDETGSATGPTNTNKRNKLFAFGVDETTGKFKNLNKTQIIITWTWIRFVALRGFVFSLFVLTLLLTATTTASHINFTFNIGTSCDGMILLCQKWMMVSGPWYWTGLGSTGWWVRVLICVNWRKCRPSTNFHLNRFRSDSNSLV